MANPFDVAVVNPLQALMIGGQSYDASQKAAQQQQQKSVLAQLMGGGTQTAGSSGPDYNKAAATLAASGDLDGATKIATIGKTLQPESSADLQAYNLYRKQGGALPFLDFKTKLAEAGSTKINNNTNVSTGGGSDKQIFDSVDESYKAAKAAATGLTGIREARTALQGGIIAGAGANQILGLQKIGAALGVTDPTSIQNTETFRAAIAPQVAAVLKASVGTTNISNSDREFAEKAAGGNITLDPGSISRLLNIMERAGSATVEAHNKRLDAIYPDDPKFKRERALFRVDPLAASQPHGGGNVPAIQTPQGNVQPLQAPDGEFYVPDPNRPGKYLQVVQ